MDVEEFEISLKECESRLDRLRALYEQYFQGMVRRQPSIPKKDLQRRMQLLRRNVPRNTALRFRYQSLRQKYTTYQTYWQRIGRQIEEGTYHRDVMNARRQRQSEAEREQPAPREAESQRPNPRDGFTLDVDLDSLDLEAEVAAAMGEATASAEAPAKADDVLAALDQVGPRSIPAGGRNAASLSPFATPSRAPGGPGRPLTPLPTLGSIRSPALRAPRAVGSAGLPPKAPVVARSFAKPAASTPAPSGAKRVPGSPRVPPRTPAGAGRPARPLRPAQAPKGAGEDTRMRRIYDSYVDARRRNNERVDNVRFESVKKTIEKQMPKLRDKHKGKSIDFEVVIRNGKVGLKPVPK